LIYFIQDYEPGFYQWSSRYLMANSTYKNDVRTIGVFNSKMLYSFFKKHDYSFEQEYYFDPVLNEKLRNNLLDNYMPSRKKQLIVYGRPSVPRNAYELILDSLQLWTAVQSDIQEWSIISIGELHPDITLQNGAVLKSLGKLTLDEYAIFMKETYMAISLMVSPHPSYPPLEMSTFGVRVITNNYDNKNLSDFNENIISLDNVSAQSICETLTRLAAEYPHGKGIIAIPEYLNGTENNLNNICDNIIRTLL